MIEIVQFNNGKYAIRRLYIEDVYEYKLLGNNNYWYISEDNVQEYCTTKSISKVKKLYAKLMKKKKNKITVIDIKYLPPTFGEKLYEQISNLKKKYFW